MSLHHGIFVNLLRHFVQFKHYDFYHPLPCFLSSKLIRLVMFVFSTLAESNEVREELLLAACQIPVSDSG